MREDATSTILVVDDERDVLDITSEVLSSAGYSVIGVQSGVDALIKLKQDPKVALLLTDVIMPGLDGLQLARLAKEVRHDLPVIYASGFLWKSGLSTDEKALILKPWRSEEMIAAVRGVIGEPN